MAVTVQDIVTDAMSLPGILASAEAPTAAEATSFLNAYQALLDQWLVSGMFGRLVDTYVTVGREAKEGERIITPAGVAITLPSTITECGVTRPVYDLSCVETYDGTMRKVWLFDRIGWVRIDSISLTDPAPLAIRGRHGLAACLAYNWADGFGYNIGPAVTRLAAQFRSSISLKYGSTQSRAPVEYF